MSGFDVRSRTSPEAMLEDYWRFFDMTPEERDQELQALCRMAMRQWLALPEDRRVRWPPEPGPHAEEILRRWSREFRERHAGRPERGGCGARTRGVGHGDRAAGP